MVCTMYCRLKRWKVRHFKSVFCLTSAKPLASEDLFRLRLGPALVEVEDTLAATGIVVAATGIVRAAEVSEVTGEGTPGLIVGVAGSTWTESLLGGLPFPRF